MARRPQGVSGSVAMAMHWDSHGVQLGITTLLPLFRDSPCFPNTLSLSLSFSRSLIPSLALSSTLLLPSTPPSPDPYANPPTSPVSSPPHPSHLRSSCRSNLWIPFLSATPGPLARAPYPHSSSSRRRSHSVAVFLLLPSNLPLLLLSELLPSCIPFLSLSLSLD